MVIKVILTIVCLVILVLFWYSVIMAKWIKNLSEEIKKQENLVRHSLSKQVERDFAQVQAMEEINQMTSKQLAQDRQDIRQLQEDLKRAEFLRNINK